MSIWDDLGGAAMGGLGGYLTSGGDLSGLLAGGLGGGLAGASGINNPLMSGLIGTGVGGLTGQAMNYFDPSGASGMSGLSGLFGGGTPTWGPNGWSDMQGGGMFSGLGNSLSGLGQYLPSLDGLFGGSKGNPQFGNQGTGQQQPGQTGGQPQQRQGGGLNWLNGLGLAGGLGLGIAGLTGGTPNVNLTQPFQRQQQATSDAISQALSQQNPEFQQAIQNYQTSRGQGVQNLDQALNGNAQFQMQDSLRTIGDRLNSMGLANGPSGAMDEALAQAAGQIKSQSLPYEANYASQTQQGLDALNQGQLQNTIGMQTGGLQRNFGLQDSMTNASLKQQLLNASQQQSRQQGLMGAGSTLLGGAMGSMSGSGWNTGAQTGANIGGSLDQAFNPSYNYGVMGGGWYGGMGGGGYRPLSGGYGGNIQF